MKENWKRAGSYNSGVCEKKYDIVEDKLRDCVLVVDVDECTTVEY